MALVEGRKNGTGIVNASAERTGAVRIRWWDAGGVRVIHYADVIRFVIDIVASAVEETEVVSQFMKNRAGLILDPANISIDQPVSVEVSHSCAGASGAL